MQPYLTLNFTSPCRACSRRGRDRGVALRPVEPADDGVPARVYASTRTQELAPVPWTDEQKDAFLRMQFTAQDTYWREQNPTAEFFVVLVDAAPAGRLYVDRLHERDPHRRHRPAARLPRPRDRRRAARRRSSTRATAGKPVTIHVEAGNRARGLYERLGFRGGIAYGRLRADGTAGATYTDGGRMTIDATRREVLQAGAAGGVGSWAAASPAVAHRGARAGRGRSAVPAPRGVCRRHGTGRGR